MINRLQKWPGPVVLQLTAICFQKNSNTICVFDKGYKDYKAFNKISKTITGFVTRIKDNAVYDIVQENIIDDSIYCGVEKNEIITVTVKENNQKTPLRLKKVVDKNILFDPKSY
ncbi:MAG TPA: hypothetical protein VK982_15255 [Bacteroidales bacterium]|nr:hypothetical protein [Bacteroidales bacterium]